MAVIQALGRIAAVFFDNPSQRMTTIGVTGSSGKTTTTWLVRGMFEELQQTTGLIGERPCQLLRCEEPNTDGVCVSRMNPEASIARGSCARVQTGFHFLAVTTVCSMQGP